VSYIDGEKEYYDLSTDPFELNNVYASLPPVHQHALEGEVAALERCHDAPRCSDVAIDSQGRLKLGR
jgi:hypothetical protein